MYEIGLRSHVNQSHSLCCSQLHLYSRTITIRPRDAFSCSAPCFPFPVFQEERGGDLSALKILFVLFWQWWETGKWMAQTRHKNKPHSLLRWDYTVSALVDLSPSLPKSSHSFHKLTNSQRLPLLFSHSLFFHFSPLVSPSRFVHLLLSLTIPLVLFLTFPLLLHFPPCLFFFFPPHLCI